MSFWESHTAHERRRELLILESSGVLFEDAIEEWTGSMTRPSVASRLETGTAFIKDLIGDIKKGEIKIPQFQRKFVWKAKQALDLLDSIASNYPIGSLLLWKTKDKLAVERNIGDFKLPETDDLTPTDYVLDGQQRITVIYSCIGAPESEPGFAAAYDLEHEKFVPSPEQHDPKVFPLRWAFEMTKMLDFRTSLRSYPQHQLYAERLDAVISAFNSYKLPIVTLKELSIEEVCPIFERINSSGTKLSIFDLMVAATWAHRHFDLNDASKKIATSLRRKGFATIKRDSILRCLTAVQFSGVKKKQILSLRGLEGEQKDEIVARTKQSLLRSVDLLSTEFGVYSWDFLPYEAIIVVLCATLAKIPSLTPEQVVRLRQWFWRAAFAERYRVGGESCLGSA